MQVGMMPSHPGAFVRAEVLEPLGLSVTKAAEILGVAPDASDEEIKAAHRELMARNHPDKGGSPWFARRLNEARDVLLGGQDMRVRVQR